MRNGDLSLANLGNLAAASMASSNSDRPSASTAATNNGSNSSNSNSSGETSLLDWINSKGGGGSLEQVADDCFRSLERLDAGLLVALRSAVESTVETSEAREMKEVKGLSERLQGMENLIRDVKRLLREQSDLGQAFLQNQQRASKVRDASILPDLCASHREQLQVRPIT